MRTVAAHPQLIGIVAHVRLTGSELYGADASSSPVVTFSYVDPGYAGIAGFANHFNAVTVTAWWAAQRRLKCASVLHFRSGDCSLQQRTEGNSARRKELTREEETRGDAAKFG